MKITVLIKEVPDMQRVRFDSERGVIDRSSASAEINPFDYSALQAAADIKGQLAGTEPVEITALTMGPMRAAESLREAYARGADRVVLLSDRAFAGADTLSTSRTLAAAVRQLGYDLVICGEKSVDGDTAQVGSEVAEMLGIPSSSYVDRIEAEGSGMIKVEVEELGGSRQRRTMQVPALISVTKNISKVKLPTVKRKLESLSVEPEVMGLEEIYGLDEENTGTGGSATRVRGIDIPAQQIRKAKIYRGSDEGFFRDVARIMKKGGFLDE